ncbi:MAG: hypothetical protein U5L06_09510 [Rhodovibrio sp.]|nr:hypothetical protein [Rhodovibrio sp.]
MPLVGDQGTNDNLSGQGGDDLPARRRQRRPVRVRRTASTKVCVRDFTDGIGDNKPWTSPTST